MQSIWVSNVESIEYLRLHDALQKGASSFFNHESALIEALRAVELPKDASLVFGAKIGGTRIPLTLLAGNRIVLFDVCDQQPQPVLCAKCDRLASYARRISLFHKPSDGRRVHCALLVTGAEKLKPYAVHICQVLPFQKLSDYLRSLKIEGESVDAQAWLATDPKDGSVILSDRIDASIERWSRFVLDGWISDAADEMAKLHKMGYRLYLTNDYSAAKAYCHARYGDTDALYGFITSSDAENMFPYGGLKSGSKAKRLPRPEDEGWEERWFDPKAEDGCRTFKRAAFEQTLQGKRLDFAVLGWGDDMRWAGRWKTRGAGAAFSLDIGINLDLKSYKRPKPMTGTDGRAGLGEIAENPRLGAYHTLLTAAKEGMVLFTVSDLYTDSAKNALMRAGAVKMF